MPSNEYKLLDPNPSFFPTFPYLPQLFPIFKVEKKIW